MTSWKKISSKLIYRSPYFKIRQDRVITPDGRQGLYYCDRSGIAASIVALDHQQNLYLIREDKYLSGEIITLPAGGAEKNETALVAAQRELKEEVGAKAKKWQSLGFFWVSPGRSDLKGQIFLATDLIEGQQQLDQGEIIQVLKTPFSQAVQWIAEGKINDAWAIVPIFRAKLFLDL